MRIKFKCMAAMLSFAMCVSCSSYDKTTDVLVIGGGASGVAAGIQSARLGVNTLIVEESTWLGGMLTSAGVSCIDGNARMPAGLFGEFRDSLEQIYGGADKMKTNWVASYSFEPSVGNALFQRMAAREADKLDIMFETRLVDVKKVSDGWVATVEDATGKQSTVFGKVLIDGTELGDVAKMVGVGYDIGMESRYVTGEDIAPEKANDIIQDITYCATLKDYGDSVDMTIEKPENYDPMEFACTCQTPYCENPTYPDKCYPADFMMQYGHLQNGKYMINWPFEANDYYCNIVEMTREQRDSVMVLAKARTMRYLYFLQKELGYKNLALADDEYPTADKLPFIPYIRESRRIHGEVRFTVNYIKAPYSQPEALYRTGIAVGDYPVDHHHNGYDGDEELPYLYFYGVPSYCLPLGTLLPKDVENVIVAEKSISVSNIANGGTRLQPVCMQIGQAAGALAALAVKNNTTVHNVPVRDVQDVILAANGYVMPYLDVNRYNDRFVPYQHIGATGILKGEGRNVAWSNETWFHADDTLRVGQLDGLVELYPQVKSIMPDEDTMSIERAAMIVSFIADGANVDAKSILAKYDFENYDPSRAILRGEFAVLVDEVLDPFHNFSVDIHGNMTKK